MRAWKSSSRVIPKRRHRVRVYNIIIIVAALVLWFAGIYRRILYYTAIVYYGGFKYV